MVVRKMTGDERGLTCDCNGLHTGTCHTAVAVDTDGGEIVPVTARDVARVAGVSISTVSRALAKPDEVSPETRDKVLTTARGMGYRPNLAARGLITGRTGNIGLLVPDLENPFFSAVAKGVQGKARTAGYAVVLADSDEDPSRERDLVLSMAST